jgi:hypothetical protein
MGTSQLRILFSFATIRRHKLPSCSGAGNAETGTSTKQRNIRAFHWTFEEYDAMTRSRCTQAGILLVAIGVALAGFYPVEILSGQEPPVASKEQPSSFWMKKKLDYSQNILAGIATADFDKIVENAEAMRKLSSVEGFIRGRTPGYRTQLHFFEESADEIIRQAKKDNVEGTALAFTQLTISCVNCHKQLRAEPQK